MPRHVRALISPLHSGAACGDSCELPVGITRRDFNSDVCKADLALQLSTMWSSARGSSPTPFSSYSYSSLVDSFLSVNSPETEQTHYGLKESEKFSLIPFFTRT